MLKAETTAKKQEKIVSRAGDWASLVMLLQSGRPSMRCEWKGFAGNYYGKLKHPLLEGR
jgi:hypothetical protein